MSRLLIDREDRMADLFNGRYIDAVELTPLAWKVRAPVAPLVRIAQRYLAIAQTHHYANVTPNGMMMPKINNVGSYTEFMRAFLDLMDILGLYSHFKAWNVPAIRYKSQQFTSEQAIRPRASEYAHSDSWLGWDQSAIVFMVPLLGDCQHNGVRFFDHDLDETWIRKLPSFTCPEAIDMISRARALPMDYEVGYIYPNDIGCIHQTYRSEDAGWRVSAEVVGYLEEPHPDSFGAYTSFTRDVAGVIRDGHAEFEALLKMGEVGAYDEQGRAIDVRIATRENIPY